MEIPVRHIRRFRHKHASNGCDVSHALGTFDLWSMQAAARTKGMVRIEAARECLLRTLTPFDQEAPPLMCHREDVLRGTTAHERARQALSIRPERPGRLALFSVALYSCHGRLLLTRL